MASQGVTSASLTRTFDAGVASQLNMMNQQMKNLPAPIPPPLLGARTGIPPGKKDDRIGYLESLANKMAMDVMQKMPHQGGATPSGGLDPGYMMGPPMVPGPGGPLPPAAGYVMNNQTLYMQPPAMQMAPTSSPQLGQPFMQPPGGLGGMGGSWQPPPQGSLLPPPQRPPGPNGPRPRQLYNPGGYSSTSKEWYKSK